MILIVEDESMNMIIESRLIQHVCPKEKVLQFMDPIKCMKHFERDALPMPSIIFSDYNMPKANGRDIHNFFKTKGFKGDFFVVSGVIDDENLRKFIDEEKIGLIRKPVMRSDFQEALDGRQ